MVRANRRAIVPVRETEEAASVCYVVDDDAAVRESLAFLVESDEIEVRQFEKPAAFLDAVEPESRGCVLLDLRLPEMNGLEVQAELKRRGVGLPVIMISGHGDIPTAVRAVKAGALDFISKSQASEELLLDKVREAMELDRNCECRDRQGSMARANYARLTRRERQVMKRVAQGAMNKEIAAELDLSEKTIEVHRKHAMEKMEAQSLAELVRLAVAMEW